MTKEDDFHGVISRNIYTFAEADPYIIYIIYTYYIKKNATAGSPPAPFGFPGGRGRRGKGIDCAFSACRKLPEKAPQTKAEENLKKTQKTCQKVLTIVRGCGIILERQAPDKRMTSTARQEALEKEPIDAEKHQLTLRGLKRSKFRKVQKLLKKRLDKKPLRW